MQRYTHFPTPPNIIRQIRAIRGQTKYFRPIPVFIRGHLRSTKKKVVEITLSGGDGGDDSKLFRGSAKIPEGVRKASGIFEWWR